MYIILETMKFRLFRQIAVIMILSLAIAGCASAPATKLSPAGNESIEDFLPRPRLEKPVARPLGRVQISWEPVVGATGYLLQMSGDESFKAITKSWTVSGNSLELPLNPGAVVWFRIRAFNGTDTSRWSGILEVKEESL